LTEVALTGADRLDLRDRLDNCRFSTAVLDAREAGSLTGKTLDISGKSKFACVMRQRGTKMASFKVVALAMGLAILSWVPVWAGPVNTYQVTGPVLEVRDDMVAVQKGKDRWELARDASTKVNGDLKVGEKVTIQYRMIATEVDVKPAKGKK
jgi:hypothetical protein